MEHCNPKASLDDYTAFHGMLCGPEAARRCIQTFEDGVALFADQEDYDDASKKNDKNRLADFDFNDLPVRLNLWSYYLLVLVSLTGFCSTLGFTKVIEAIDYNDNGGDHNSPRGSLLRFRKGDDTCIESSKTVMTLPLRLPPEAMEYVIGRSISLGPVSIEHEAGGNQKTENTTTISGGAKNAIPELVLTRRFEYDFGGFLSVMMLHFLCTNGRTHLVEIYRMDTGTTTGLIARRVTALLYRIERMLLKLWPRQKQVLDSKKTK